MNLKMLQTEVKCRGENVERPISNLGGHFSEFSDVGPAGRHLTNFIGLQKMFNIKNALIDFRNIDIHVTFLFNQGKAEIASYSKKVILQF